MTNKFLLQKDERAGLQQANILPQEFWVAFLEAKYPADIEDGYSHHLEIVVPFLMQGRGYASTELLYSYALNLVAIKGACYMSLYPDEDLDKRLGTVNVNPKIGWRDMKYIEGHMEAYPLALDILRKIRQEFLHHGFSLGIDAIRHGSLPFLRPVKCIAAVTRWETLLKEIPPLTPVEKATLLGGELDLDAQTAAEYTKWAENVTVRIEAEQAAIRLYEVKVDVINQWKNLTQKDPSLTPAEKIEIIAQDVKLDPATIAGLATTADDPVISKESRQTYFAIAGTRREIPQMWEELMISHPEWSPAEKAEWIAAKTGLAPISVCIYTRISLNTQVRAEASKGHSQLGDLGHKITERWQALLRQGVNLDPRDQVTQVATEAGITPALASYYGARSDNADVKYYAHHARGQLADEKHRISHRWHENGDLDVSLPSLVALVKIIANDTGLKPSSVAGIASFSPDPAIRSGAMRAKLFLAEEKFDITKKWREILDQKSPPSPIEQAKLIGAACNLTPGCACFYAQASGDKDVRFIARKASSLLAAEKYDITGKWGTLLTTDPAMPPVDKATAIAEEVDLDPITVARLGTISPNFAVRKEATCAASRLLDMKHDISTQWSQLRSDHPDWTPSTIARQIAQKEHLSPQGVAHYAVYSENDAVRKSAAHARALLVDERYHVAEKWRALSEQHPELAPLQKLKLIAGEAGISPVLVASISQRVEDPVARKEMKNLVAALMDEEHGIVDKWREVIRGTPNISGAEVATRVANQTGFSPVTIARYVREACSDWELKKQAWRAYNELRHKNLALTPRWQELLKDDTLTPAERAKRIARDTGIAPTTAAVLTQLSPDKHVKKDAGIANTQLLLETYDLTSRWHNIQKQHPKMSPADRAKLLATEVSLTAGTIARSICRSPDAAVRAEAFPAVHALNDEKHGITRRWQASTRDAPSLNPKARAEQIARDLDLSPAYVVMIASHSPDEKVRAEVAGVGMTLKDEQLGVTQKWRALIEADSPLSPVEKVEAIARELEMSPGTVARVAAQSADRRVVLEARKTGSRLGEKKYSITETWKKSRAENPGRSLVECLMRLADAAGISIDSYASYAKASGDASVRKEANQASDWFKDEQLGITKSWQASIDSDLNLPPEERVRLLAQNIRRSATSIASIARRSPNTRVKKEAILAYSRVREHTAGISEKWKSSVHTNPELNPLERCKEIAKVVKMSVITVATLGTFSPDPGVAKELREVVNEIHRTQYTRKIGVYTCSQCGKTFKLPKWYQRHLTTCSG